MIRDRRRLLVEVASVAAALPLSFAILQTPARTAETRLDVSVLRALGVQGIDSVQGNRMLVVPAHHRAFIAVVTSSCSSLAPVLALACLALILPPGIGRRRWFAVSVAMAAVVAGNLVRIDASVGIGLLAGRASLILFHNWVGSLFSFAYILGSYVLVLWLVLPKATADPIPTEQSTPLEVAA